jgi:hypothetical protein
MKAQRNSEEHIGRNFIIFAEYSYGDVMGTA